MSYEKKISEKMKEHSGRNFTREESDFDHEQRKRRGLEYQQVVETISALDTFAHGMGHNETLRYGIVEGLSKMHRHQQAILLRTLLLALGDIGIMGAEHPAAHADGRNSREVELLTKMQRALSDDLYWEKP